MFIYLDFKIHILFSNSSYCEYLHFQIFLLKTIHVLLFHIFIKQIMILHSTVATYNNVIRKTFYFSWARSKILMSIIVTTISTIMWVGFCKVPDQKTKHYLATVNKSK